MAINGFVAGLLVFAAFGLICSLIMIIKFHKGEIRINSSYNYRPKWATVDLPADVRDKVNTEGVKWLLYDSGALFCAIIIGCVYALASGNTSALQLFLLVCITLWVLIMFAITIGVYVHAWSLEKKYKAGKA